MPSLTIIGKAAQGVINAESTGSRIDQRQVENYSGKKSGPQSGASRITHSSQETGGSHGAGLPRPNIRKKLPWASGLCLCARFTAKIIRFLCESDQNR